MSETDSIQKFDEAINLLKLAVKDSHLKGQKHIDLTLAPAEERHLFEKALMLVRQEVVQGNISEEDLKTKLGLIS